MEKFQVGDKVNFLNATGGGTVKKILDTRMVEVTIEDGRKTMTLVRVPCVASVAMQKRRECISRSFLRISSGC